MKYRFPKKGEIKFGNGWSFAIVNGRLAEIYFKNTGIWGHCYVEREKFNKAENRMIKEDTKRYILIYRKKIYFDRKRALKFKIIDVRRGLRIK